MSSSTETASNTNQINESSARTLPDHEDGVHFTPPLYRQRYKFVLDTIEQNPTLHSLLDIGCGTCQLLTMGKYRNPHVQLVAAIDINPSEIEEGFHRLKPLPVEYINFRRETPLQIYLLSGNALNRCQCFDHFDVVTLIEVIEHLYLEDLQVLIDNVFAQYRPRIVIVTTPNADFNVLFGKMTCGQFRHADHKFEFTREQFQFWAQQIAVTYQYGVEFHGVGEAPLHEQHRNIGTCTQIAIFHQQSTTSSKTVTSNSFFESISHCPNHLLFGMIDYPYDTKKPVELYEQVGYILEMYRLMAEDAARHGDDNHDVYPLTIDCEKLFHHPRLIHAKLTRDNCQEILDRLGYKLLDDGQIILSQGPLTSAGENFHNDDGDDCNYLPNCHHGHVIANQSQPPNHEESWD